MKIEALTTKDGKRIYVDFVASVESSGMFATITVDRAAGNIKFIRSEVGDVVDWIALDDTLDRKALLNGFRAGDLFIDIEELYQKALNKLIVE
jgi:hypothetical protein